MTYEKLIKDREILLDLLEKASCEGDCSKINFLKGYLEDIEHKLLSLEFGDNEDYIIDELDI